MAGPLTIFEIPVEVAQRILAFCHPWDVAAFSRSCRAGYNLVYIPTDQHLWRQLYLAYPFDHPEETAKARIQANLPCTDKAAKWKTCLTDLMKAELTALRGPVRQEDRKQTLETLVEVLQNTPVASVSETGHHIPSHNLRWLDHLLRESSILNRLDVQDDDPEAGSLAQLRSCLPLCLEHSNDHADDDTALERSRNKSRNFVYDLRNYNADNHWGPYHSDGRVNWVHIEHLMNVIKMNLRELPYMEPPTPPLGLEATRPHAAPGQYPIEDWAGVEGTWSRYVSFMDYRDLFAFNYTDVDGPRNANFFENPLFREATRLLEIKLRLIQTPLVRFYGAHSTAMESMSKGLRPPLYFAGSSRGPNGNEAIVEGFVYMAKDGTVRWRFMSIYDNSPQWSSNGVQVGNVGSAMGVVGVWTTTHHDQGDPVGPFWLWKNENERLTHVMEYT